MKAHEKIVTLSPQKIRLMALKRLKKTKQPENKFARQALFHRFFLN